MRLNLKCLGYGEWRWRALQLAFSGPISQDKNLGLGFQTVARNLQSSLRQVERLQYLGLTNTSYTLTLFHQSKRHGDVVKHEGPFRW